MAGNGSSGYNGDGIPATSASLYYPPHVYVDPSDNLYIADKSNARVRRVDAATGLISTVAGTGTQGYSGDGGPATSADIYTSGVWTDTRGNVYIADEIHHVVRQVRVHPAISSSSPVANDVDASRTEVISATFSEAMSAAGAGTFVVHRSEVGNRSGAYGGSNTSTLTFDPDVDFHPGEEVAVTLTTNLDNTVSGSLVASHVWQFRAAAGSGPADFTLASRDFGTGSDHTVRVALGDLDADGTLDIAVGNNGIGDRVPK